MAEKILFTCSASGFWRPAMLLLGLDCGLLVKNIEEEEGERLTIITCQNYVRRKTRKKKKKKRKKRKRRFIMSAERCVCMYLDTALAAAAAPSSAKNDGAPSTFSSASFFFSDSGITP
jgi:hypothetical protein